MIETNGNFPQYAYLVSDTKNIELREPFKCRIIEMGGEYYNQAIEGLIDQGTNAVISTRTKIQYTKSSAIIMDDIMYSIIAVRPFIPDTVAQGVRKKKRQTEYIIQLG